MTRASTAGDLRVQQLRGWLQQTLQFPLVRLEPASNDASFRRYFRVWHSDGSTRVVMDAPPDKEDTGPFLQVAALLERCGVHVPHVHAADAERGFLLLEDLGSVQYLTRLRAGQDPERLYGDALEALLRVQLRGVQAAETLPPYDRALLDREMALMPEWFCGQHLQLELEREDRELLRASFDRLIEAALEQPRVLVHRDYHSRNLLISDPNPGIVDFQDAVFGPVTYDLVSLLKDCYIEWPRSQLERWVCAHHARLLEAGFVLDADERQFLRWFDLMGVQRHIKVLGIFARLWWRDGKSGYLADLPRTLQYVREAAASCEELSELSTWLERRVLPVFGPANARVLEAARVGLAPGA